MTFNSFDDRARSRRLRRVLRGLAFASAALHFGCSISNSEPSATGTLQDANTTVPDTSVVLPDAAATMLDRVAAIVAPNCAVSGCHDAQTKEHGMDLSTGPKIYSAWVNQLGLDHCRNMGRARVVPGSPETSLVMTMITGALCEAWPRMPPPPRTALTTEQIDVIRTWIGAGAPLGEVDSGPRDGGSDVADVSADSTKDVSIDVINDPAADVSIDPTNDAGGDESNTDATDETNDDAASDAASDIDDALPTDDADACNGVRSLRPNLRSRALSALPITGVCTDTMPCSAGLMCLGNSCAEEWSCIPHLQGPGEHPCPPDNVPHCGCDGVTFMSPTTCEDRPWVFVGACADGVSCDASVVPCGSKPPTCPAGQVPSIVNGDYGYCVDVKYCRCDAADATLTTCPAPTICNASTKRCSAPTRDQ